MGLAHVMALVGMFCLGLGLCMLLPMAVGLWYREPNWTAFLTGALASMVLGAGLWFSLRDNQVREMNHRQGMAVVALSWLAAAFLGGLPLYLSGDFASYTDAFFEASSGFTTTGASVLTNVEKASRSVLFWRALTHWLGGMGFIVLSLAILPFVGVGGMQLYKAEVPSPTPDRLQPRIADTAGALWKVYALLTGLETLLLMLGGMDWFDAVCHSFATLATGGFSTKNASIAAFESAYIEWVVSVFMFLAGINFSLHYRLLRGRWKAWLKDEECRFYLILAGLASLVVALALGLAQGQKVHDSLRLAVFQVATILTTTGFATADYALWTPLPIAVLLVLMFVGGSAGSTGGGPKVMRVMVVFKQSYYEFLRLVHPRLVAPMRLNGQGIDRQVVASVWSFLGLYLACFVVVGLILAALGSDLATAFSASIACLGNIGPGLAEVGPAGNYAGLGELAKWVLALAMIVGRLEIYTVLILLVPEFWRR
ncbi:MAG: TrkH family potassium uptake protein [Desulfarculus sp.]|nr:TrkH family potassium uptake protein [Desulfarculus sp.]